MGFIDDALREEDFDVALMWLRAFKRHLSGSSYLKDIDNLAKEYSRLIKITERIVFKSFMELSKVTRGVRTLRKEALEEIIIEKTRVMSEEEAANLILGELISRIQGYQGVYDEIKRMQKDRDFFQEDLDRIYDKISQIA